MLLEMLLLIVVRILLLFAISMNRKEELRQSDMIALHIMVREGEGGLSKQKQRKEKSIIIIAIGCTALLDVNIMYELISTLKPFSFSLFFIFEKMFIEIKQNISHICMYSH